MELGDTYDCGGFKALDGQTTFNAFLVLGNMSINNKDQGSGIIYQHKTKTIIRNDMNNQGLNTLIMFQ